jgi:hypothetical protein
MATGISAYPICRSLGVLRTGLPPSCLCLFSSHKAEFELPCFYLNNSGKVEDLLRLEVQQKEKLLYSQQEKIKLESGLNRLLFQYLAEPCPAPGDLRLLLKRDQDIVAERKMRFHSDEQAREQLKAIAEYLRRFDELLAGDEEPCPYLQSKQAYKGSFFLGFPVRFITERRLTQLERYELLIVPGVKFIPDSQLEMIHNWVKKGGCLVLLDEVSFSANEWGVERNIKDCFADLGTGTVLNIPANRAHRKYIFSQLQDVLAERKIRRTVEVLDQDGNLPWALESREIANDSGKSVYILNLHTETQNLRLRSSAKITAVQELISEQNYAMEFSLPPRSLVLLKVSLE